jgi:hypothetical protein
MPAMPEPHASAASAAGSAFGVGLVAGLSNPAMQHWALVAVGAGMGAFLAVSAANTVSVRAAGAVFLRAVLVAVLFTSVAAFLAAPYLGTSYDELLMPVAGLLAWRHDKVGTLIDWAVGLIRPKRGTE